MDISIEEIFKISYEIATWAKNYNEATESNYILGNKQIKSFKETFNDKMNEKLKHSPMSNFKPGFIVHLLPSEVAEPGEATLVIHPSDIPKKLTIDSFILK